MARRWLLVVLVASRATAWSVDERESFVQPSSVRARLDRTTAVFDVRYGVDVKGPEMFSTAAEVPVPPSGVAVAATVTVAGAAHRASLTPAHDAETAFEALTMLAGGPDRRAVVVLHSLGSVLTADIASPVDAHLDVDITYEVPTCWFRDARYAAVPHNWPGLRAPDVPVDEIEAACGANHDVVDHDWVSFPVRDLAERRGGPARIGVFADGLDTGIEHIARVEIDLAGQLDATPPDLATAIVIDASRSMQQGALDAQRELVESYLRNAPTSRVQLLAYARTARSLLPSWTPASHAFARVDRELRALDLRNGSNLDAGLAAAASWLGRVRGTHRILLFTDELVAKRLQDMPMAALRKLVPRDTVMHVIALDGEASGLTRDDAAMFAPLARATLGMPARAGLVERGDELDARALVRPRSLDGIKLVAPGWTADDREDPRACSGTLAEGTACAWWLTGHQTGPITVEGWLWGEKIERVLRPDPTRGRTLARELTGRGGLDTGVQKRVDRLAQAVNDEWSLVATWGGKQGYADAENHGRGYGLGSSCCHGHVDVAPRVTIGHIGGSDDLRGQLAPAIAACKAEHNRVEIDLELTQVETVGVEITVVPRLAGDAAATLKKLHDCVMDAVWDIPLTLSRPVDHDTKHVVLGPG